MVNGPSVSEMAEVGRPGRPVPNEDSLLGMGNRELDELFRGSPPGEIPTGVLDGTAVLFPGRRVAVPLASIVRKVAWRGKVVEPAGRALRNRLTLFDIKAIAAVVYREPSQVDGRDCIVLDYSITSVVAGGVRDEIRLVAAGLYLGVVWWHGRRVSWFLLRQPGH